MLNTGKSVSGCVAFVSGAVSDLIATSVPWQQSCIAGSRRNEILGALSTQAYLLLSAHLKEEDYAAGHVLWEAGSHISDVFLPVSGLLAIHSGEIEVATVGQEGAAGFQDWPSHAPTATRGVVRIAGRFLRIPLHAFAAACNKNEEIRYIAGLCNGWLLLQSQHLASCNATHPARTRFCRWLLRASDALDASEVSATQERIADALGIRRPTAVLIAKGLQSRGTIEYRRGKIRILDREALQTAACDCYTAFNQSRWPSRLVGSRLQIEGAASPPVAIDTVILPKRSIPVSASGPDSRFTQLMNVSSAESAVPIPSAVWLASSRARIEYCPATAPAIVHEADAVLMILLEGTGKLVTGGTLAGERVAGVNSTASARAADNCRSLSKGDVLIVPANTPYQLVPTGGSAIVLITIHLPSVPSAGGASLVPRASELVQ
jgi:CRP-like cAMP-binding protein/mannose-6-phosphate isomerase-like protein (cupin superfamily)